MEEAFANVVFLRLIFLYLIFDIIKALEEYCNDEYASKELTKTKLSLNVFFASMFILGFVFPNTEISVAIVIIMVLYIIIDTVNRREKNE